MVLPASYIRARRAQVFTPVLKTTQKWDQSLPRFRFSSRRQVGASDSESDGDDELSDDDSVASADSGNDSDGASSDDGNRVAAPARALARPQLVRPVLRGSAARRGPLRLRQAGANSSGDESAASADSADSAASDNDQSAASADSANDSASDSDAGRARNAPRRVKKRQGGRQGISSGSDNDQSANSAASDNDSVNSASDNDANSVASASDDDGVNSASDDDGISSDDDAGAAAPAPPADTGAAAPPVVETVAAPPVVETVAAPPVAETDVAAETVAAPPAAETVAAPGSVVTIAAPGGSAVVTVATPAGTGVATSADAVQVAKDRVLSKVRLPAGRTGANSAGTLLAASRGKFVPRAIPILEAAPSAAPLAGVPHCVFALFALFILTLLGFVGYRMRQRRARYISIKEEQYDADDDVVPAVMMAYDAEKGQVVYQAVPGSVWFAPQPSGRLDSRV